MTLDEARHLIVEGINYAAYLETDSLYDFDKNRLWVLTTTTQGVW
jgi:hypothetical protein